MKHLDVLLFLQCLRLNLRDLVQSANNSFQVRLWCERQLSIHACFCVALWDTNAHHIRSGVHLWLSWTLAQVNIEHSMLATNTWYCRQRGLQTICKQKCKPRRQQLHTVTTVAPGTHSLQSSHKQIFRNRIAFSEGSCQDGSWHLCQVQNGFICAGLSWYPLPLNRFENGKDQVASMGATLKIDTSFRSLGMDTTYIGCGRNGTDLGSLWSKLKQGAIDA